MPPAKRSTDSKGKKKKAHPLEGLNQTNFLKNAPTLTMKLEWENEDPIIMTIKPKIFNTGSFGWGHNGRFDGPGINLVEKEIEFGSLGLMSSVSFTVVKSKELPVGDSDDEEQSSEEEPQKKSKSKSKKKVVVEEDSD